MYATSTACKNTKWTSGAASACAATLLALGLCSASIAAPRFASPTEAKTVLQAKEMIGAYPISTDATRVLAAELSHYGWLPDALIATARSKSILSEGSNASTNEQPHGSYRCEIAILFNPKGHSTIAADMRTTMGIDLSPLLERKLLTFEALHELGHCAAFEHKSVFSHPALTPEQNAAFGWISSKSIAGKAWAESYADAYAGLSLLKRSAEMGTDPEADLAALRLVHAWRASVRSNFDIDTRLGPKYLLADGHLDEESLAVLLADPKRWEPVGSTIEEASSRIASIGLARTLASTPLDDPARVENATFKSISAELITLFQSSVTQEAASAPKSNSKESFLHAVRAEFIPSPATSNDFPYHELDQAFASSLEPMLMAIASNAWTTHRGAFALRSDHRTKGQTPALDPKQQGLAVVELEKNAHWPASIEPVVASALSAWMVLRKLPEIALVRVISADFIASRAFDDPLISVNAKPTVLPATGLFGEPPSIKKSLALRREVTMPKTSTSAAKPKV